MLPNLDGIGRPKLIAILLAGGIAVGAGGGLALGHAAPFQAAPQGSSPATLGHTASLADMVEAVAPSVVQIRVTKEGQGDSDAGPFQRQSAQGPDDQGGSDGAEANPPGFGPEEGRQAGQPAQRALGSGFIIDRSGIVLTNNHVVDGATQVVVQLSDGREFKGQVLGADPKTDVAVVRILGGGNFKPVRWGDSDYIRAGDGVFAVGSPFGLGNTVTAGILSARSRDIGEGPYDDFLQVDAAINSGNSGGPLFDSQGRVVGINTAIYSPSGGNVGIGFAIPQRMAQKVAQQIITSGSVSRGRIGVSLQPITPQMAASLGLQGTSGALIADVDAEGAGAASGLERGDVVRSFGGVQVKDGHALARMVADAKAGSNVAVSVLRNGQQVAINLRIGGDPNA
jgi:serine protease Do